LYQHVAGFVGSAGLVAVEKLASAVESVDVFEMP